MARAKKQQLYDIDNVPDGLIKPIGGRRRGRKKKKNKKKRQRRRYLEDTHTNLPLLDDYPEPQRRPLLQQILEFSGFVRDTSKARGEPRYQADHGHGNYVYWLRQECMYLVEQKKASEVQGVCMFVRWLGKPEVSVDEAKEAGAFKGWYHIEAERREKEKEHFAQRAETIREKVWRLQTEADQARSELWRVQEQGAAFWRLPTLQDYQEAQAHVLQQSKEGSDAEGSAEA